LPDAVLADLHLTLRPAASSIESDPAFLALAHKPAVASEDIASKPAVFAPQDRPATAPEITANIAADLANAPALNAATLPETPATLTPAGEGNLPEFFSGQSQIADAAASTHSNIVGRVVVNLPNGETRFLADVEVRAYPADVLAGYLRSAQTRSRNAAQQIMAQAELATKEGRLADAESLKTQAAEAAGRTIEYIPAAPYIARTDAHGYFTVRHDLRDVRLLAVGYVTVATGKMRYEWVGLQPEREIILTEANATTVAPPTRLPRFASR
jgi:hypothetical protein